MDGGQHSEQVKYAAKRDASLTDQGYRVLRFWNTEVLVQLEAVKQAILDALEASSEEPPP